MLTRSKARSKMSSPPSASHDVPSSRTSVVSFEARKKQLEFEAAEERARLLIAAEEAKMKMEAKLQETRTRAQMDLVEKKLSASLAELEELQQRRSRTGSSVSLKSAAARTDDWVAQQNEILRRSPATQNVRYSDPTPTAQDEHHLERAGAHDDHCPAPATQDARNSNPALQPVAQDAILKLADAVHDLALGCAHSSKQATAAERFMGRIAAPRDLPIFKGDPMEWLHFKNFYDESTKICQFSNAENVCRLRKCLTGEAKECVSALLMGDVSADNIINTLELRFGRPEIIIYKIQSQLKKLPSLSLSYHNEIVSFSIKIKNCVVAMKAIKQDDYLRSPELTSVILSKLPCSLITRWADYAHENREKSLTLTRLEQLCEFLEIEAQKISNVGISLLQNSIRKYEAPGPAFHSNPHRPHLLLAQAKQTSKCRFCLKRTDHIVIDCPKFKRALRKERWSFVRANRLCPKCLVSDHDKTTCEAPLCTIDNCGLPHHQTLHWPIPKPAEKPTATDDCATNITAVSNSPTPSHVLLKYARVRIHGPNGDVVTDALLDDGSTITMIDEDVANQVGLRGRTECLQVRGAWDNSVLVCQAELVNFEISGEDSERYKIIARTVKGINLPSQYLEPDRFEHLEGIEKYLCSDHMKPSMIIGQDNYNLLAPLEIIEGDPNATRTVLGWSVHGSTNVRRRPHGLTNACTLFLTHQESESGRSLDELNDMIRRSYALDALGVSVKPRQCSDDVKALQILDKTSKQVGDHWEVGLPWKDETVKMKDSYPTAFSRLQGVEKKMRMNPDFQARYRERVQHLFENKYAHPCSEPDTTSDRLWYLPHFGVDNPNKKKLRLVFDAAAKSQGYSLNDYLLQGPDLLISLFGVLLRFREHQVAVTGDIKDMFLRVQIRREDQDALRFLWKDDISSSEPPTKYAMNSLIFGACCSPFVAQYVKNKNAMLYEKEMPRAVRSIVKNHYVDDLMDSLESESAAVQLVSDVREIHKMGGFEIRNWTSNSKKVLESIPEKDLGPSAVKFNIEGTSEGERTLGLYWFPADDVLSFDVSMKRISEQILKCLQRPTKREMLRVVMSVFDVQGFLAPLTIKSRILLQDTWRSGIAWDEHVKDKEFTKWRKWLESFEKVKALRIPRWYLNAGSVAVPNAIIERELHMFCDASPQAYAAVAYWRLTTSSGVTTAFIASKSRVAPLRPVSVPRLELQGAVLACRLAATIEQEHTMKPDRKYFWTDSSTVLLWIMSDARNYKPFVANRLGEIDELTRPDEWRYVPTSANAADFATKENVDDFSYTHTWFHGPEFLRLEKAHWPENKFTKAFTHDDDVELKKATVAVISPLEPFPIPDPKRFSSWTRLLRATATLLAAIERWKKRNGTVDAVLMNKAETLIVRQAQIESFPDELRLLNEKKPLSKKSKILSLSPYLDHEGILRVQGRIDAAADVSTTIKRPAILDGRSHVSRLIIMHFHVRAAHANNETVINELRQRFWIIHLRPSVRSVASKCLICRIRKATPIVPRQGDLPAGRLAHHCRPFSHCGLDLFGPIDVTVGRRREKRYGVIFTCMTVRAIHLEVVHSLSTDSLIMALRRMAARRGWPTDLYSDNGTNLRGADAELNTLQTEAANSRVRWHFNPPLSPHMGGAWERLIRSVKTALKVILKERAPRDETLLTLLCEVEAIVNSRPLTHVSVNSVDDVALTPFHFLLGTSSNLTPIGSATENTLCSRKQWRVAQSLADMFWARWLKEVLPCLSPRTMRQTNDEDQLRVGDVVIVIDPASERGFWPRGVIDAVYPGADGRVRVADVRTSRGTLRRRSAMRLARLLPHPRGEEC